jgi:ribosome-associated protein
LPLVPECGIADYFVICQSDNSVHNQAIAKGLVDAMLQHGLGAWHVEGREDGSWIVVDYVDVVVHIMLSSIRSHYDLESLWGQRTASRNKK